MNGAGAREGSEPPLSYRRPWQEVGGDGWWGVWYGDRVVLGLAAGAGNTSLLVLEVLEEE